MSRPGEGVCDGRDRPGNDPPCPSARRPAPDPAPARTRRGRPSRPGRPPSRRRPGRGRPVPRRRHRRVCRAAPRRGRRHRGSRRVATPIASGVAGVAGLAGLAGAASSGASQGVPHSGPAGARAAFPHQNRPFLLRDGGGVMRQVHPPKRHIEERHGRRADGGDHREGSDDRDASALRHHLDTPDLGGDRARRIGRRTPRLRGRRIWRVASRLSCGRWRPCRCPWSRGFAHDRGMAAGCAWAMRSTSFRPGVMTNAGQIGPFTAEAEAARVTVPSAVTVRFASRPRPSG